MIAETNVLSPSLWTTDLFSEELQTEFFKPYCSTESVGDLEFVSLDPEFERSKPNTSSCSQSSASSECSMENDAHGDHDYYNPTIMNLFEDNIITEPISLYELSLGAEEDFVSCDMAQSTCNAGTLFTGISNSSICSVPRRRKKCKLVDPISNGKLWSSMSQLEQKQTVSTLSEIISEELGLREQLDVIRIIDPTAAISATDTEFIIDLTALTDEKLQSVREYVCNAQVRNNCNMCSTSPRYDNGEWSEDSSGKKHHHKKEVKSKKRGQQKEQKAIKQRQKKEHRQLLKEKRSGLFLKEEVLSIGTNLHIDDDNMVIDILE